MNEPAIREKVIAAIERTLRAQPYIDIRPDRAMYDDEYRQLAEAAADAALGAVWGKVHSPMSTSDTVQEDVMSVSNDTAVAAIAQRLHEARQRVEERHRLLRGAQRDRDLLILKLAHAGIVERAIAPIAGVSNIRVNQVKRDGIEGWRKRYGVEQ